ncbi:MAG: hypothetical protein F4156_16055 [Holophagales bacterium]|nr:hypothetical protein [Holophagales bacterium]
MGRETRSLQPARRTRFPECAAMRRPLPRPLLPLLRQLPLPLPRRPPSLPRRARPPARPSR